MDNCRADKVLTVSCRVGQSWATSCVWMTDSRKLLLLSYGAVKVSGDTHTHTPSQISRKRTCTQMHTRTVAEWLICQSMLPFPAVNPPPFPARFLRAETRACKIGVYVCACTCVCSCHFFIVCVWFVQSEPIQNILHTIPLWHSWNAEH